MSVPLRHRKQASAICLSMTWRDTMTLVTKTLFGSIVFFAISASAQAGPTASSSVFATGGAVGGTPPDSVTIGDGSVWVEYGNGADSTGAGGSSTIVQHSPGGAVQHSYTISGLVDRLKFNPVTGVVWALQNNDGNATLSLINPTTHTVSGPLSYAVTSTARGYDDVAFLGGKVYLSYTNPVNPTDPVLQILNNGNSPTGTLTTPRSSRRCRPAFPCPIPTASRARPTPNWC